MFWETHFNFLSLYFLILLSLVYSWLKLNTSEYYRAVTGTWLLVLLLSIIHWSGGIMPTSVPVRIK
jgi:hypothetical protein